MLKRLTAFALAISFFFGSFSSITFAHNDSGSERENRSEKVKTEKVVDVACIKTAIETRDKAIVTAVKKYSDAAVVALEKRMSDLLAAWGQTDKTIRKEAIKQAWETSMKSVKDARRTFKQERKDAWKAFKESRRTCGGSSEDDGGERADSQL